MKKHSIELRRIPNAPIGYGVMDMYNNYKISEREMEFSANNNVYIHSSNIRHEEQRYTDGRYIESSGWSGGEVKRSHKYFAGCELQPEKIKKPWTFCDKVVWLDIYYYDNNSLLEENRQLKEDLKNLAEKYNVG